MRCNFRTGRTSPKLRLKARRTWARLQPTRNACELEETPIVLMSILPGVAFLSST